MLCRSRAEPKEESICQRTAQFSNAHPNLLPILEFVPFLLVFVIFYPLLYTFFDPFVLVITIIPTIIRNMDAWHTKAYSW
jgi:hypothetical protein